MSYKGVGNVFTTSREVLRSKVQNEESGNAVATVPGPQVLTLIESPFTYNLHICILDPEWLRLGMEHLDIMGGTDDFFKATRRGALTKVQEYYNETKPKLNELALDIVTKFVEPDDTAVVVHEEMEVPSATALHYAVQGGHLHVAKFLLERGASPNVRAGVHPAPSHGITPFQLACVNGNVAMANLLLQYGADYKLTDDRGLSTVFLSVIAGRLIVVQFLESIGASLTEVDLRKRTLLHVAASLGDYAMVRYLIKRGHSCRATDEAGFTPLHLAAMEKKRETCKILIQADPEPLTMTSLDKRTPVNMIRADSKIAEILQEELLALQNVPSKNIKTIYHTPTKLWTLLCILPFGICASTMVIGSLIPYGILGIVLGFAFLAGTLYLTQKYLFPPQRNPFFACMYYSIFANNTLLYLVAIIPDTMTNNLLPLHVIHVLLLVSLPAYTVALRNVNPGRIVKTAEPNNKIFARLIENQKPMHRFCYSCEVEKSDRARHCRICDHCVHNYDHHCFWLETCIGAGNRRIFVGFLLSLIGTCVTSVILSILALSSASLKDSPVQLLWHLFLEPNVTIYRWIVTTIILTVPFLGWIVALLVAQVEGIVNPYNRYHPSEETEKIQVSLSEAVNRLVQFIVHGDPYKQLTDSLSEDRDGATHV